MLEPRRRGLTRRHPIHVALVGAELGPAHKHVLVERHAVVREPDAGPPSEGRRSVDTRRIPLVLSAFRRQARGSVVERFLDTEEVGGSIPPAPTSPRGLGGTEPEEGIGSDMLKLA